jgi:Protein of unknown function (DUF2752)
MLRASLAPPLIFAGVFAVAQGASALGIHVSGCLLKALLGVPCPGCGITTSVALLLRGRFEQAFDVNAAGLCVVLFVVAQLGLTAAVALRTLGPSRLASLSRANDRFLLASLLLSWIIY